MKDILIVFIIHLFTFQATIIFSVAIGKNTIALRQLCTCDHSKLLKSETHDHSVNPDKPHFCPTKKTKYNLENNSLVFSTLHHSIDHLKLYIQVNTLFYVNDRKKIFLNGFPLSLYKPPKHLSLHS